MKISQLFFIFCLVSSVSAEQKDPPERQPPNECGVPNNGADPKPARCPMPESGGDTGGDPSSGPNPNAAGSGNFSNQVDLSSGPIRPNSGGARLMALDVKVPGTTGDTPMSIERHYQSRDVTANADLMGHGRTWTHTYSWRMWSSGTGGANRSILFPDGYVLNFVMHPGTSSFEGQTAVRYIPQAGFGERLFQVGHMWHLLIPGGERFSFEPLPQNLWVKRSPNRREAAWFS